MGSRPKTPKPTKEEVALQQRQREETARLDDEENVRFKRILSGRLGNRRLLSSSRRTGSSGRAGTLAGTSGGSGGGGGGGGGSSSGMGSSAGPGRMTVSRRMGRTLLQ